jgi:hypothetical protein
MRTRSQVLPGDQKNLLGCTLYGTVVLYKVQDDDLALARKRQKELKR